MSRDSAGTMMRLRRLARNIRRQQDNRYQHRQKHAVAYVTGTNRDGAARNVSAAVTVDGLENQTMAISYGSPVYARESYLVRNDGSPTLPRWTAVRRLHASNATPSLDRPTLPTPTGLLLESQSYLNAPVGGTQRSWLYAYWYIIGDEYGPMNYEVQYATNDPGEPTVVVARDDEPQTFLVNAIDDSQVIIPHVQDPTLVNYEFVRQGRIRIEAEYIDYTARTHGDSETGTGTSGPNTFTVSGAGWTTNEWSNFVLEDYDGNLFLILSNSSEVLTISGTPLTGAYTIYPCFSGCTRGVSGTDANSHIATSGVTRLSCGITIPGLFVSTDYNVRVRAVRDDGAISAWTDWVTETTGLDSTAPAAPTDFDAESQEGGVWFSWSNPLLTEEPDLAGFNIYEATDDSGTGASLLTALPISYGWFYSLPVGYNMYYNIKSRDLAGNLSDYGESTWLNAVSLGGGGKNLLTNSDFERDFDDDDWPDGWYEDTSRVDWGDYGMVNGKGIRFNFPGWGYDRYCFWPWPYNSLKVPCSVDEWYTVSVYFWTDEDEANVRYDGLAMDGYLDLTCTVGFTDDAGAGGIKFSVDYSNVQVEHLGNGWRRVSNSHQITEDDLSLWNREFILAKFEVCNKVSSPNVVYADRVQLERTRYPSAWQPGLIPPGDGTGSAGLLIDGLAILTRDKTFALGGNGKFYSGLAGKALSADPTTPSNSEYVIWVSDGTDSGDDGDLMIMITDSGGTTKTITLADFSAF